MNTELTHLDANGAARMVDVSEKEITTREAIAEASIHMAPRTAQMIVDGEHPKGDVLAVARVAGIQAAKKTPDLIPLCHPLMLTSIKVNFDVNIETGQVRAECYCKLAGRTGVEMEALTGASVAVLTLYDMCKAVQKDMTITDVRLLSKIGGKSGEYKFTETESVATA